MSDAGWFLVVLGALHLWECLAWIGKQAVAFVPSVLSSRWKVGLGARWLEGPRGDLFIAGPLPPLRSLVVSWVRPYSLSPDGVLSYASHTLNPSGRQYGPAGVLSLEEAPELEAEGDRLLHRGKPWARTGSRTLARDLTVIVRRLAPLDEGARATAIDAELDRHLSAEAARERLALLARATAHVRLPANLLFFHLFAVIPATYSVWGILQSWPYWIGAILALHLWTAIAFVLAHARLFPETRDDRWFDVIPILLYSPSAMRAADPLAREALAAFHPLAVARALGLSGGEIETIARRTLLDLAHPIEPVCPVPGEEARGIEAWYRGRLLAAAERWAAANGLDREALMRTPEPQSTACRAYCPRCRAQYVSASGSCVSCGGIALAPLDR